MTIPELLKSDDKYFEYFSKSIMRRISYFEYDYVFGDSASAKILYIEKRKCDSYVDGLVNLIIPFLYHQGFFRVHPSHTDITQIFDLVNEDLELDVYWESSLLEGNLNKLREDLKIFPDKILDSLTNYVDDGNGRWVSSNMNVCEIIEECYDATRITKSIFPHLAFEYYLETETYYILFRWGTGA